MFPALASVLLAAGGGPPASVEKLLCGNISSFRLQPGDVVLSQDGGVHAGITRIRTRHGMIEYSESDIIRQPRPDGPFLKNAGLPRIRRVRTYRGHRAYAAYGYWPKLPSEPRWFRAYVFLEGPALSFTRKDWPLLRRLQWGIPDPKKCNVQMSNGFDEIYGHARNED